jgi:O-methyltransferase domain
MSTPTDKNDAFAHMAFLSRAYQVSKMIQVAAALGLADRVADGPRPAKTLALEAGAEPVALLRLCRALAAFGIFSVDADGQVSQTTRSECLRQDAKPTLHHAAMYWTAPHVWGAWANLEHAVRTGESAFESVFHTPKFEYLKTHPEEAALFDLFMQHSPEDRHAAVVAAYDFSKADLVVDIGGGNGALLAAILHANANTRGLLFDQEAVVAGSGQLRTDFAARVEVQSGSFFETIPAGGDIYLMSQILHDWDDARASSILSNARKAMGPNKRLLVIERLMDHEAGRTNPMSYLADINMMVNLHGRERTLSEFAQMLQATGFGAPQVYRTRSSFSLLEAFSL